MGAARHLTGTRLDLGAGSTVFLAGVAKAQLGEAAFVVG